MPSVKNPNGPSANKLVARAAKARQRSRKQAIAALSTKTRVQKADTTRGAREGLLPTSGPNRALSAKRRRKMARKLGYAQQRIAQAEGEVVMRDQADVAAAQKPAQNDTAATETTVKNTATETTARNQELQMMDAAS